MRILFLSLILSAVFSFPLIAWDPAFEYDRMVKYHHKMDPFTFQHIYYFSRVYHVDYNLICGLITEESGWSQKAISVASARGLMQVMRCHYRTGNPNDLYDIGLNIDLGTSYLKTCIWLSKGQLKEALRFYNAGPASSKADYKNWKYVNKILKHTSITTKIDRRIKIQ